MMRAITRTVAISAIIIALSPVALAAGPEEKDLTNAFRAAGASIDRLQVYELAGVVILRGRTPDKATAEELGRFATTLGYARVANLIQIVEHDDVEIARLAERELTIHRSLDGCKFRVTSAKGVIHVAGTVTHELQKDVAAQVLRSIDGVRAVEMQLDKF